MARMTRQADTAHEDVWWSEAEYRKSVGAAAGMQSPDLDVMFMELTDDLLRRGILRRESRFGVPGYAFRHVAVVVTPAGGGH